MLRYLRVKPNDAIGTAGGPMLSEAVAFAWLCLPKDEEFWVSFETHKGGC